MILVIADISWSPLHLDEYNFIAGSSKSTDRRCLNDNLVSTIIQRCDLSIIIKGVGQSLSKWFVTQRQLRILTK